MERPEPQPIRSRVPSVDEISTTPLTITYELLEGFDHAGVLDTFFRLPRRDQANFMRWIGATDDTDVRRRRTETFVSALQAAPLESFDDPRGERRLQAE